MRDDDSKQLNDILDGIQFVNEKGYLHISEPSEEEKQKLNNAIISRTSVYKSQRDIVEELLEVLGVKKSLREKFHGIIGVMYKEEFDRDRLYEIILTNYNLLS